jgi:hypothetical protein
MSQFLRRGRLAFALVVGIAAVPVAAADSDSGPTRLESQLTASASWAEEDEVVLPSRVAAATRHVLAHIAQEEDATPIPSSVARPILRASAALNATARRIANRRFARALESLSSLQANLGRAHSAGMAQIGAPPTDPEEDTPPGPVSVLAVLDLEHRVTMRGVALSDGLRRDALVSSLRDTLWYDHHYRDAMLDAVIELPPEGAGSDYADGMADTVPSYVTEVNRVKTARAQYQLTDSARLGLNRALDRIQATQAKVNEAFGGGE